tara:strand:- start:253 stop:1203 length:951 start_codon:yes stop_codon:yes gene_type:complete
MESIDASDEKRYKDLDVDEIISNMDTLFQKEILINSELKEILNPDALMALDFKENADILGMYFLEGYSLRLFKNGKKLEEDDNEEGGYRSLNHKPVKTKKANTAISLLKNPSQFNELFNVRIRKGKGFLIPEEDETTYSLKNIKIQLIDQELEEKVKALIYKKYIDDISPFYGFALLTAFILVFTICTQYIENNYITKNASNISYSEFTELREQLNTLIQPATTMLGILIVISILFISGLLLSVIPLYLLETTQVSNIPFGYNLFKPFLELFSVIGNIYLQNIPESRFFLVLLMPISIIFYTYKVSRMENLIKKAK